MTASTAAAGDEAQAGIGAIRTDVAVIGAGPAGAAASIALSRAGRRVVVVDKATFPRDKFCGDGLTAGALRLLENLGLDPSGIATWRVVDEVVIRSPSGRSVAFPLPEDGQYAAVVPRIDLDAAMVDLAQASGAQLVTGVAAAGIRNLVDRVELDLADGRAIHAGTVVAADGMWSPTRKLLGIGDRTYLGEWHAFRQYFENVGDAAAGALHVWFEPDVLPGYVWSFPLPDRRANVGFGIQRGTGIATREMKAMWPELLNRPHIRDVLGRDARPESPHRAWPIPARLDRLSLSAGRVLFVGDAAAATDPMTGEGIGQALLSGMLAAEAVLGSSAPPDIAAAYERSIARELRADHRFARALGRILRSPLGARGAVRATGLTPWTRRNFGRWLFEDYPRAVAFTPRRWQRDLFTGPGAFRA